MSKSYKKKQTRAATPATVKKVAAPAAIKVIVSDQIAIGKNNIPAKKLFVFSLIVMGIFMLAGASQVGVAADEPIDYSYGEACLHYFSTFGKDTSYAALKVNNISFPDQKYYGAAFEMVAPLINAILQPKSPFPTHHILCAIAGILLLLYTGLIAKRLKGWSAGFLAMWIIFLTPIVTGNAFFNSKDIPFAAAFAAGFYYLLSFLEELPTISRPVLTGLTVSVAVAVSIRISGILLPAYIVLFAALWYFKNGKRMETGVNFFQKYFLSIAATLAGGTLIALVTYPNFWHEGMKHISGGLAVTKRFQHNIFMLYHDTLISSQKIDTASYLLKYLEMTVPELVLGGFLLSAILLIFFRKRFKKDFNWMLFFAAIFPFAYVILIKAPVYNGWRHLLFAYPFVVVITALGFTEMLLLIKKKALSYAAGALIVIVMMDLLVWQVRAFPYNYVYFNHISGGLPGIYKHYDTDYQQLSTHDGVKWLLANEKDLPKPITILSNNANALKYEYDSSIIKFRNIAIKDMWMAEWDYAVVSTVFLNEKAINAMFPPGGTIHIIDRFGVPLTYVVKRQSRDDVKAYDMIRHDSIRYAAPLIDSIYRNNPTNTMGWYWEACNLFEQEKYAESLQLVRHYDELFPNQDYIYELIGYNYYYLGQWQNSLKYLSAVYKKRPGKKAYNKMIGDCLTNLGRQAEAQPYYEKAK